MITPMSGIQKAKLIKQRVKLWSPGPGDWGIGQMLWKGINMQ